jgi:ABC-type transport system substrate-binding protein
MTDDVTITLILGVFALILVSWAWYLYGQRRVEITKKELNTLFNIEFDKEYLKQRQEVFKKPAKRPRLYKQATVVTKGELPRKAPVKKTKATPVKKTRVSKTTTMKGKK